MYWKSSKNFVDPTAYHIRDSICITDVTDPVFKYHGWLYPYGQILGPAGGFTFRMKNVSFMGDPGHAGALSAGQHCLDGGSGGPCNVQYLLEDVDFSGVPADRRFINFGVHAKPSGEVLPMFIAKDSSLGGYRSIVSKHLNGFAGEGCEKLDLRYDHGYGCPFGVRRLNIWSKKTLGAVQLVGPGYDVPADFETPTEGKNAGHLSYAAGYNGYGAVVIEGRAYAIKAELSNLSSDVYVDFSDSFMPAFFNETEESVRLTTDRGDCEVHASEAHGAFYERYGPVRGASLGDCKKVFAIPCHTAIEGDPCYGPVDWAYNWGVKAYPKKFPTLTVGATREQIQMYYYLTYQADCPEPCLPDATVAAHSALRR